MLKTTNNTGGTNARSWKRRTARLFKKVLPWLVLSAIIAYAGAGYANTLYSAVTGSTSSKVKQAVIVDLANLDVEDVGLAANRAQVSASRDGTQFSAAGELQVGEEMVFDLPLINRSKNAIEMVATITNLPEEIMRHVEVFWDTVSRSSTPDVYALDPAVYPSLDPVPKPVTDTLPQGSDTQPSDTHPTGAATAAWQESDATLNNTPPLGLPANPTQMIDAAITTTQPAGTLPGITPRDADADTAATNIRPDGLGVVTEQVRAVPDGALTMTGAYDGTGDTTTFAVDWAGDVGEYTSIAALDANTILVSYVDATSGDLNLARSYDGGTTWTIYPVEQSHKVSISLGPGGDATMSFDDNASVQFLASTATVDLHVIPPSDPDYTTTVSSDPLYPTVESFEDGTEIHILNTGGAIATVNLILISTIAETVEVEIGDDISQPTTVTLPQVGDTVTLHGPYSPIFPICVNLVNGSATVITEVPPVALSPGLNHFTADLFTSTIVIRADSANTVIEFWEGGIDNNYTVDIYGPVSQYTSLSAPDTNNLLISYYDPVYNWLQLARSADGGVTWVYNVVDYGGGHDIGKYNSLFAFNDSLMYVSYYDIGSSGDGDLKFARSINGGANWTIWTVDDPAADSIDTGQYTSLAVTGPSDFCISYYDATYGNLKFAVTTDAGASWTTQAVSPNPSVTINLDMGDTAAMNVASASSSQPAVLELIATSGDATVTTPSPPDTTTISDDYRDPTVVSYSAVGPQEIEAGGTGASVQINLTSLPEGAVTVQIGKDHASATMLTLGETGDSVTIYGTAMTSIDILVSKDVTVLPGPVAITAFAWDTVTIGAGGYVTIQADEPDTLVAVSATVPTNIFMLELPRTVDIGQYSSIAAPAANTIYISSYNASDGDLMFASSSDGGTTWTLATVDDPATPGSPPDPATDDIYDVGKYSSIAALGAANLFISYYDATSGSLKLAQSTDNGATWSYAAVDDVGLVGSYTSIAALTTDTYFISYRDIGDEDLLVLKPVISCTWYPGTVTPLTFDVDLDGDGTLDSLYYVLTDLGSDGDIDFVELSADNSDFGVGDVTDTLVTTANNDERIEVGNGDVTSQDVILGVQLFTVAFDNWVSGGLATASIAAKTWYTGTFTADLDADGALDIFDFALSDADSNGLYDTMDITTDDMDFGETGGGTLFDQVTGSNDDERIGSGEDVRLGAYYTFEVSFSDHPYTALPDATLLSQTWLTADYDMAANSDSVVNDRVYYALSDTDSDGRYDTMDVSLEYGPALPPSSTFGEGALSDLAVDTGNDERITAATALYYGEPPWSFATDFDIHPGDPDGEDVFMTPQTRFTGQFVFDAGADGTIDPGTDDLNYVLSDTDGDGIYETMDISLGDLMFGDGLLSNEWLQITNDERLTANATLFIGETYAIQVEFVNDPLAQPVDARILLVSRSGSPVAFTGWTGWVIDADGDAVDGDWVNFVLTDAGSGGAIPSDGVVDTIDISISDQVYGEGSLGDALVDFDDTDNTNDERVAFADMPYLIQLGLHYFLVEADTAIYADKDDARITSRWYVGTFPVDVDNDQIDNTIDFVQVDPYSYGLYTVFELDGDDSDSYEPSEVYTNTGIIDHLWDVWGTSGSDVVTVGYGGDIRHYDGTQWGHMSSTTPNNLYGVWGSASDDIFAVGAFGTILHYDGTSWIPMVSGTTDLLTDVWGSADDDVFAVGYGGTILHYDGISWSAQVSGTSNRLLDVWGISSLDVFAVGYDGTILYYNGINWSAQASGTTVNLNGIWGSAINDVFAVGDGGTILHYNGIGWSAQISGTTADLNGIWGSATDDVFAVGDGGTIQYYDGTSWIAMDSSNRHEVAAVWGSSSSDVFAVGFVDTRLHYDGRDWASLSAGLLVDLNGHRLWLEYWANPAQTDSAMLTDGNILEVCRQSENEWIFIVPYDPNFPEGTQSQIRIKIALPDDVAPGFYQPIITIEPLGL